MIPIQPTLQNPVQPDMRLLLNAFGLEMRKQINCVRIGIIQSFNEANQTATIQIAQQQITSIQPTTTVPSGVNTTSAFAPLVTVPVMFPCGGGYTLTFPIKPGDECIVLFNDRELDNWLLSGGTQSVPTTHRVHDLADGIAVVGVRSFPRALAGVSTTTTQLRSDDGETFVDIDGAGHIVTITAPTQIILNSPNVVMTGTVTVENTSSSSEPFTVNGTLVATGDVQANSGAISLVSHVHTGVQSGGSNTGPATG